MSHIHTNTKCAIEYGIKAPKKPNNIHSNGKTNKQKYNLYIDGKYFKRSYSHTLPVISKLKTNCCVFRLLFSSLFVFFSYHKNWLQDVRLQRSCSTISVFCAAFHLSIPCLRSVFFLAGCSFVFICIKSSFFGCRICASVFRNKWFVFSSKCMRIMNEANVENIVQYRFWKEKPKKQTLHIVKRFNGSIIAKCNSNNKN